MDGDLRVDSEPTTDPRDLLDRAGLDDEGLARRKAAIGLTDRDAERLSRLQPVLRERRAEVVERATESAGRNGPSADDGADGGQPTAAERIERTWRTELTGLGSGTYDESFAEDRAEIATATAEADVPLSEYLTVHGRTCDRVFADLEARTVEEIEAAFESWAADRADQGLDRDSIVGGLAAAVGGAGEGKEDGEERDLEELRATIRQAVAEGFADAGAIARICALDAGIAADTASELYRNRAERAARNRDELLGALESDVEERLASVHETAGSVAECASTITELAGAQAEEVPAAASELDDLSATVEEVAATAGEVRETSADTEERAEAGLDSAREAAAEMEAVRDATESLVSVVDELEERAERIDAIADGIGDVASRSKVLASNAQAQANRDVDATRSLEVLSDEISSFADETREQLGELPAEVAALQEVAETVGRQVERADDRVTQASDSVTSVECEIEAMAEAAETTADNMDEVAAATDRQATAAETISESVGRLARRSEQIAAETESVAAATEEQAAALGDVLDAAKGLRRDHSAPESGGS